MKTSCSHITKLAKDLEERKIAPTYFLELDIRCAPETDYKQVRKEFISRMDGALYEMKFSTESVSVAWHSAGDIPLFWTQSELTFPYILNLALGLVKKVATEIEDAQELPPMEFRCNPMIRTHICDVRCSCRYE